MFTLKVENKKNEILELTQNECDFQVVSVTGLNPVNAQINRSTIAGLDGAKFNSSKLEERNIVITLRLNGDVTANRIKLYRYFNTKQWCKIYYKNSSRDVYIEGYIETCEVDLFSNSEIMQISIICPNPYFKALEEIIDDISKIIALFEFPFSIEDPIPFSEIDLSKITNVQNNSEIETGVIIEVEFLKNINKLLIRNTDTGQTMTFNYAFKDGDFLTIDTNKGSKSLKLVRNAEEINIFSALSKTSEFIQLQVGDNYFSYLADDGENDDGASITFRHYTLYGGV